MERSTTVLVSNNVILRVALGENDSFFAWSEQSFRWGNLHTKLERHIQRQLGAAGWKVGPPTWVSIGMDGSYYVVEGRAAYWRASAYPSLDRQFKEWSGDGVVFSKALKVRSYDVSMNGLTNAI